MSDGSDAMLAAAAGPQTLPEYWPAAPALAPIRPVRVPWPLAVAAAPLFWFMPKRMGAHLAEAGWLPAMIAHLLWTVYGIGCILIAVNSPRYGLVSFLAGRWPSQEFAGLWPQPTLSQAFRAPLVELTNTLYKGLPSAMDVVLGLCTLMVFELLLIAVAALLMPYAAAGERARRLFARCVKLTLWSTTSLIVPALWLQTLQLWGITKIFPELPRSVVLSAAAYGLWFAWIWIRSGIRYAGPPEGLVHGPQVLRCGECGYRLTGLSSEGRCPECGLAIKESLPEHRTPSRFAAARPGWGRIKAFLPTGRDVLLRHDFFKRLAIRGGHEAARSFAIGTCFLGGFLGVTTYVVMVHALEGKLSGSLGFAYTPDNVVDFLLASIGASILLLLVVGLGGLLSCRFGLLPVQRIATLTFYQAAWLLPIALCEIIVSVFVVWVGEHYAMLGTVYIRRVGRITWFLAFALACHALPIGVLVLANARLQRMFRQTRYACD